MYKRMYNVLIFTHMNKVFIIGESSYNVVSPSIKNIVSALSLINEISKDAKTLEQVFERLDNESLCKVLSIFIAGDFSLVKELLHGQKDEIISVIQEILAEILKDLQSLCQVTSSINNLVATEK